MLTEDDVREVLAEFADLAPERCSALNHFSDSGTSDNGEHRVADLLDLVGEAEPADYSWASGSKRRKSWPRIAAPVLLAACMIAFAFTLTVVTRHASPSDHGRGAAATAEPLIQMASPAAALRSSLISQCRDGLKPNPKQHGPGFDNGHPTFWKTASPVLVNTYAGSGSVLLVDGELWAGCVTNQGGGGGQAPTRAKTRPAGSGVLPLAFLNAYDPTNFTRDHTVWLIGRAGPNVAALIIHLHDGQNVAAVISPDGWWQAWAAPQEQLTAPQSKEHPGGITKDYNTSVSITDNAGHTTHQQLQF